jgi:hypothetical protein
MQQENRFHRQSGRQNGLTAAGARIKSPQMERAQKRLRLSGAASIEQTPDGSVSA